MFLGKMKQKVTIFVVDRQFLSHLAKSFGGVAEFFNQETYI